MLEIGEWEVPRRRPAETRFHVRTGIASVVPWAVVAILGVGRLAERPIVRNRAVIVAATVVLTLVLDHRAVDGQPAALFLAAVRDHLERGEFVKL
jgi:pyruvate/2-oxoglutarate dehydrogenase complex dihydrolipoamide acyltransferase (E2) component